MTTILIDLGFIGLLGVVLLSGRLSTARAFALFAAAVIITGRISFDGALDRLTTPAILAVTSLVIIASALAKLPGLSRFRATGTTASSNPCALSRISSPGIIRHAEHRRGRGPAWPGRPTSGCFTPPSAATLILYRARRRDADPLWHLR